MEINNIDDYIKLVYPEPNETDKDYNFFRRWGYEQYLIKTRKYNLEQLRILLVGDYNLFRVSELVSNKESLVGLPIVKSKKILHGFWMSSVPKGFYGVCLWEAGGGEYFCIFPKRGVFPQLMKEFTLDEIEITDEKFTTEEDLVCRLDKNTVTSGYELENNVCYLPELGNIFVVKTWANDYYHGTITVDYTPATYEKKKWVYAKGKKNVIRKWAYPFLNLEDAKILQRN